MDEFLYMVRCLHQLRLEAKEKTQSARDFDIVENARLYGTFWAYFVEGGRGDIVWDLHSVEDLPFVFLQPLDDLASLSCLNEV